MDEISRVYLFYGMISVAVLAMFLIFVCALLSWHNDGDGGTPNPPENVVEYQPIPIIEPIEEITEKSSPPIVKPRPRKRKKPTAFAASMEGLANIV